MNTRGPNVGSAQSRAPDRRRKGVIELETGTARTGGRVPGMAIEYTGWDVYNNEAKKVDSELVNDWRESLNSLLLFAAIFAAVLTAFIIESKKMLELDPTSVMVDVMIFYTNNVANGNHTAYTPFTFEPDSWAITVNCLFFASLSTSLVTALASVVSLQWVADYDAAITRGGSSPEDRAKRRQFRYAGVIRWKMGEIIAALPLLLYCSVVLFFGGLALWMWEVNYIVGSVVVVGAAVAVLFYGVSTFLAVVFVSAPFRTRLSRWIYSSTRMFLSLVYQATVWLPMPRIPTRIENRVRTYVASRRREDREVENRSELAVAALLWLANELSVSQDSYERLILLVGELPKLKQEISCITGFRDAPWFLIFDLLGWKALRDDQDEPVTPQDVHAFTLLSQCYRLPEVYDIVSPTGLTPYVKDPSDDEYWSQYCDITRSQWSPEHSPGRLNSLFLLLRDLPLPSTGSYADVEVTIRLSRWRNSPRTLVHTSEDYDPKIAPSITHVNHANDSIVNLGMYPRDDELALWFSRDDEALYTIIMRRMISTLGFHGIIPPTFLDALRWRFEAHVAGVDNMSDGPCLSRPARYRKALYNRSETLKSLHYAFILLLARSLNFFVGDQRVFRFKEILTMLWASPIRQLDRITVDAGVGMECFYDANESMVKGWIETGHHIPYIHEILRHLSIAQAMEPSIGSLWRSMLPQDGDSRRMAIAFIAFQYLLYRDPTAAQHYDIINLLCQDISLGPTEVLQTFTGNLSGWISDVEDPCLRLLAQSCAGPRGEYLFPSSQDIGGPFKDSWTRVASHLMAHLKESSSPVTLRLQGALWSVVPGRRELCSRALKEPEVFVSGFITASLWQLNCTQNRLQRIFEYPIACSEHCDGSGHLLLHLLDEFLEYKVDADLTTYTSIPIMGRTINVELALMILPENRYYILPETLNSYVHTECLTRILEIGKAVMSSQLSALSILSELCARLVKGHRNDICSEELAAIAIAVLKALKLPKDPRVGQIIPPLVSRIRRVSEEMHSRGYRSEWERRTADTEANIAINKLMADLATIRIFGGWNGRVLACAQTQETHDPAIGWLGMHNY